MRESNYGTPRRRGGSRRSSRRLRRFASATAGSLAASNVRHQASSGSGLGRRARTWTRFVRSRKRCRRSAPTRTWLPGHRDTAVRGLRGRRRCAATQSRGRSRKFEVHCEGGYIAGQCTAECQGQCDVGAQARAPEAVKASVEPDAPACHGTAKENAARTTLKASASAAATEPATGRARQDAKDAVKAAAGSTRTRVAKEAAGAAAPSNTKSPTAPERSALHASRPNVRRAAMHASTPRPNAPRGTSR